jgi:hypothetical protein
MAKMPAWSYSALTAFETCPRQYHLVRVLKIVSDPPNKAATHGNEVHKAFEIAVRDQVPLPEKYSKWQNLAQKLMTAPGKRHAEMKIALNANLQPTGYFAKDVWLRCVLDYMVEKDANAVVLDYKTGKRKPDSTQLELFAAVTFKIKPYLQTVKTGFLWLPDEKMDKEVYHPEDMARVWGDFAARVARMQHAFTTDTWTPKPSGLCRQWCPCTSCEFNGRRNASS